VVFRGFPGRIDGYKWIAVIVAAWGPVVAPTSQ